MGSYLGTQFSYLATHLAASVSFAVCIAMAMLVARSPWLREHDAQERETRKTKQQESRTRLVDEFRLSKLFHIGTIPFAMTLFFEAMAYGAVWSFIVLVGQIRGIPNIAMFFTIYTVIAMVTRPFVTRLYDRIGLPKLLWIEALIMAAAVMCLAFAYTETMVYLASVLFALGQGSLWPSCQAECVRDLPLEETALAANTLSVGADSGMFVGPLICGFILEHAGLTPHALVR